MFDEALMREMQQSWAVAPQTPYDIYIKTLYALVKDRLEDKDDRDILWDDSTKKLADFQKVAVRQAVQIARDFGGAFVADVVGLGKSYIGAAILEKAFRAANLTSAVKKELNTVRRNNLVGENLMKTLVRIYQQHNIRDWIDRQRIEPEKPLPRIICREALV